MPFKSPKVGLNIFHVCLDLLHLIDLGIAQYVCASTIYMLVFDTGLVGTLENKMGTVWEPLRAAYESLNTLAGETLPHTIFTNIFAQSRSRNPTAYPELHAKGAQARHCIGGLRLVVRDMHTWAPASSYVVAPYFNFVWELIANLATFYDCLWYRGQWLPPATAQESYDYLLKVGVFHQALCTTFMQSNRLLFRMTEKAHYVQHVGLDILKLLYNPRFGWTY